MCSSDLFHSLNLNLRPTLDGIFDRSKPKRKAPAKKGVGKSEAPPESSASTVPAVTGQPDARLGSASKTKSVQGAGNADSFADVAEEPEVDDEINVLPAKNLADLTPTERRVATMVRDKVTTRLITENVFPDGCQLREWIEFDFFLVKRDLTQLGKDVRGERSLYSFQFLSLIEGAVPRFPSSLGAKTCHADVSFERIYGAVSFIVRFKDF